MADARPVRPLIPLAVTAHNEERAIGACLESLLQSVADAEARLPVTFDLIVILDRCTDRTAEIVRRFPRVRTLPASGGLVEAQRVGAAEADRLGAPFLLFSDADIAIERPTLGALVGAMLDDPHLQIAYPRKAPLPPRGRTLIARALYTYNRTNGFQTPRRYFNGRLFAIRRWHIPTVEELRERIDRLPADRFYTYERGICADDIYLSRHILAHHGPEAIREIDDGLLWFRPPETYRGMYRTWKRMRMEIERLDALFPESRPTHRRHGVRGYDPEALRRASVTDRCLWYYFRLTLQGCKAAYHLERLYHQHLARGIATQWDPIPETKHPIDPAERGSASPASSPSSSGTS